MSPRAQCIKELIRRGFVFKRSGKNHDIYFNPRTKQTIPVKRHDFDENDKRYILKEADGRKDN